MSRISKDELFRLRNHINIKHLITEILALKTRNNDIPRFCCPICHQYHTATNEHTTNLARCFFCDKNFNTIDLVKVVNRLSFVDSVEYLRPFLHSQRNLVKQEIVKHNSLITDQEHKEAKLTDKYVQENAYPGESWQEARKRLYQQLPCSS